jgi:two-component system response regulator DesR
MAAPAESPRIRVIIIDDHPVALTGIRVGLKRFRDIHLESEALDGASGLAQIEERKPDVAVVDVQLPDMDGLEVASLARELSPDTRIILTSGDLSIATMSRASQLGVAGFFHKSGAVERLALLIRSVMDDADDAESLEVPEVGDGLRSLTSREHELLMLLANGASLAQSAARMGMSHAAAEHLEAGMMQKLGVESRVDLIRLAAEECLVHSPGL